MNAAIYDSFNSLSLSWCEQALPFYVPMYMILYDDKLCVMEAVRLCARGGSVQDFVTQDKMYFVYNNNI